jgi:hypothetical protein
MLGAETYAWHGYGPGIEVERLRAVRGGTVALAKDLAAADRWDVPPGCSGPGG